MGILSFLSILVFGYSTKLSTKALKEQKNGLFKISFIMPRLSVGWWALCSSQFFSAPTKSIAWMWLRISSLGWIGIFCFTSIYIMFLTGNKKFTSHKSIITLYIMPALILFLYNLFGENTSVAYDLVQSSSGLGWTYVNRIDSFWLWFYILSSLLYMIVSIYLLYKGYKIKDYLYRINLSKYIIISDVTIGIIGMFLDLFLPLLTDYLPPLAIIIMFFHLYIYNYLSTIHDTVHMERYISSDVIFKTSTAAFLVLDENGKIFYCNDKASHILEISKKQLLGMSYKDLLIEDENFKSILSANYIVNTFYDQILHVKINNTNHSLIVSKTTAYGNKGSFLGHVVSFQDITKLIEVQEYFKEISYDDYLTHLPNRRMFNKILDTYITDYQNNGQDFGLLYLDLDDFKKVNDEHGHEIGDLLLTKVGNLIASSLNQYENIFRLGGDEFAILIKSKDLHSRILELKDKLEAIITKPHIINNITCYVGLSCGYNIYSESRDKEKFIKKADINMYTLKYAKKAKK